jgi:hypothetical protein
MAPVEMIVGFGHGAQHSRIKEDGERPRFKLEISPNRNGLHSVFSSGAAITASIFTR